MPERKDTDVSLENQATAGVAGNRVMTREQLYALVWETPMSRLAKRFGLSDVGLRKICVKHGIPTPPLGYWARLAHGKKVHRPPLPPLKDVASVQVHLHARLVAPVPPAVEAAQAAALKKEAGRPVITVPAERPDRFHPVAAATAKALRAAKADHEGFKHGHAPGAVHISIGDQSVDRTLRIIDAFARAVAERSHGITENEQGVRIVVDGVPLAWRLYEIKDRKQHVPTREELKEQARREEYRARWPELYSRGRDTKAYRSWDYFPSGRLAMDFTDTTRFGWGRERLVGRWHDRKGRRLEDYLDEAMAALVTGAVAINHRLADEAEKERLRAEELERQRRAQARRERALRRHEFVLRKADDYARFEKLAAFADFLEHEAYEYSDQPVDRIIDELKSLVAATAQGFTRDMLNDEIIQLRLYTEDDAAIDPAIDL
jgi:hypothetical protein